jgi:hypothetical protein
VNHWRRVFIEEGFIPTAMGLQARPDRMKARGLGLSGTALRAFAVEEHPWLSHQTDDDLVDTPKPETRH